MASVHGISNPKNRRKFCYQKIIISVCRYSTFISSVMTKFFCIIAHYICNNISLSRGKAYDFCFHNDPIRAFRYISHTDILSTVMKKDCNLKKKPFSRAHSMNLFYTVKNSKCNLRRSVNVVFSCRISFCNIFRCHNNIIFKIVGSFYKIFLLRKIIRDSIKKRNSRGPECLCIKYFDKVFTDNHCRDYQRRIFRINLHHFRKLLHRHILYLFVLIHKFCFRYNIVLPLLLKNSICQKISHEDYIFNITIFEVKPLKAHNIISNKFFYKLSVVIRCFLQFF